MLKSYKRQPFENSIITESDLRPRRLKHLPEPSSCHDMLVDSKYLNNVSSRLAEEY
jgi:hypothetical protein